MYIYSVYVIHTHTISNGLGVYAAHQPGPANGVTGVGPPHSSLWVGKASCDT